MNVSIENKSKYIQYNKEFLKDDIAEKIIVISSKDILKGQLYDLLSVSDMLCGIYTAKSPNNEKIAMLIYQWATSLKIPVKFIYYIRQVNDQYFLEILITGERKYTTRSIMLYGYNDKCIFVRPKHTHTTNKTLLGIVSDSVRKQTLEKEK